MMMILRRKKGPSFFIEFFSICVFYDGFHFAISTILKIDNLVPIKIEPLHWLKTLERLIRGLKRDLGALLHSIKSQVLVNLAFARLLRFF